MGLSLLDPRKKSVSSWCSFKPSPNRVPSKIKNERTPCLLVVPYHSRLYRAQICRAGLVFIGPGPFPHPLPRKRPVLAGMSKNVEKRDLALKFRKCNHDHCSCKKSTACWFKWKINRENQGNRLNRVSGYFVPKRTHPLLVSSGSSWAN